MNFAAYGFAPNPTLVFNSDHIAWREATYLVVERYSKLNGLMRIKYRYPVPFGLSCAKHRRLLKRREQQLQRIPTP